MDTKTCSAILARVRADREKRASEGDAFAQAVRDMAAHRLKAEALGDVGSVGLAALGVGAAGRGAVGLYNVLKRGLGSQKHRGGPAELPLPYPVEPEEMPAEVLPKAASFLSGDAASTKAGVPWFRPAAVAAGVGGLGLGWAAVDKVLDARRRAERDKELEGARGEFHDALLSQYDRPLAAPPGVKVKKAGDLAAGLDDLYDRFSKAAVDWGNAGGAALGGYGVYAGLSGLLAGTVLYDKMRKRSRRAVLEKALQRRERRRFMQSPTEIYAVPEPVARLPRVPAGEEVALLSGPDKAGADGLARLTGRR
jgi:hypothetical protein